MDGWRIQAEHNKQYEAAEDKERFEIFKNNLKHIIDHNEKFATGEVTFSMGLNQFADMRAEERFHGGAFKK